jgi:hypothetical protein
MKYMLVERTRTRLATAAIILLHIAVSVLVVISMIQAFQTIAYVIQQMSNLHDKILIAALATAFVLFGCLVFWGCNAFVMQFHDVFRAAARSIGSSRGRQN